MEIDQVLDPQKRKDFFISYTGIDQQWAEWIAFELEKAEYTVIIQAWDFRPGSNFVGEMDKASQRAERTLIVLSPAYLESDYAFAEWAAALRKDPKGKDGRVLPVRIQKCEVNGLLGPIVYIDMVGLDKQHAQEQLLAGVRRGRVKPTNVPFPDVPATLPDLPAKDQMGIETKDQAMIEKRPSVDVCIVCALAEEALAFLTVVEEHWHISWTQQIDPRYGYNYRLTSMPNEKGEPLNIHVSWLSRYGSQEMLLHLNRVIEEYQPRLVAMTGICAGDKRRVKLGDLVVAERTFTYDTGKMVKDEQGQTVHQSDTITYQIHENTLQFLRLFDQWKPYVATISRPSSKHQQRDWLLERLAAEPTGAVKDIPLAEREEHAQDWRQLVHELQRGTEPFLSSTRVLHDRAMVEHLRDGLVPFPFKDAPEAQCYISPLASGSAVRSDDPFKDIQIPVRGAVAIDMEGAAFGRVMESFPAIEWLIVKGVSDYADQDKDDSYHSYAAIASATYMLCFIEAYVTQERFPESRGKRNNNRDGPIQIGSVPSSYSQSKEIPNESTNTSETENGTLSNLHPLLNSATKDGKYQPGEGIPKPNTRRNMRKWRLLVSAAILLSLVFSLVPFLSPSACFFAFCNTSQQPTKQPSSQDGEVVHDQNLSVELGAVVSSSFVIPDDPKRYSGSNLPPMGISAVLLTRNPSPYETIIINVKNLRYGGADILINYIALKLLSVPALPQSLKVWTPGASTTYVGYPYPVKYTSQTPGQLLYARPPYNDTLTPAKPGHSGESDPLSIQVKSTVTAYLWFQIQISYQVTDTGIPYKLILPRIFKVVFSDASNWHEEIF